MNIEIVAVWMESFLLAVLFLFLVANFAIRNRITLLKSKMAVALLAIITGVVLLTILFDALKGISLFGAADIAYITVPILIILLFVAKEEISDNFKEIIYLIRADA